MYKNNRHILINFLLIWLTFFSKTKKSILFLFVSRYGRDYYINDAKTASGSRALKTSGDLNLLRIIDDDGVEIIGNDNDDDHNNNYTKNHPENDYDTNDSVSDLLDSFNSIRSEQKCRYRYAHLPKPLTTNMHHQLVYPTIDDVQRLGRSQSVCSLQTGLRNRFNCKSTTTTMKTSPSSPWVLNGQPQQYQSLQLLNRKQWLGPRPSSPSPSLPATLPTHGGNGRNGDSGSVVGSQTIAQLERDALHRDIRRNSLSSRRGTRNFVINPLYNE